MAGSLYIHNERADSRPSTSACNMPKRKCIFTNELQKKFPTYSLGRDKWEAAFTVCKPATYVSVSNGGATDLTWTPKNIKKLCEVRVVQQI